MNQPQRHTALITLAIAVTLFVASANIYMHHVVFVSLEGAVAAHDSIVSENADNSQQAAIQSLYQSTAADRAKLKSFFIPGSRVVSFLETLEALGPQAGSTVTLSSIAADSLDSAPSGTLGTAHAHVDVKGSWQAVMRTLMLAETMPYKTTIDNVQFDVSVSAGDLKSDAKATDAAAVPKRSWSLTFEVSAPILATGSSTPKQ